MGSLAGHIPVDHLIRRMYGTDDPDLDNLHKLSARQLAALKDFVLEKLSAPGSVDKDVLKKAIIAEITRLLTT